MRYSRCFLPTLRDDPADAEVASHTLLLRAGFLRKLSSGIYSYLPFALRVLRKIEKIVRDEMAKAGAEELLLPILQPSELWQETGRWQPYGKELMRLCDRNDREIFLGPTHEEVITDLIRREIRSYRSLPLMLYQIQTKFRDEIRPRFGIMRGREFMMKDAYSFDATLEGAQKSYQKMFETYQAIFSRLGLRFRAVEADTGLIGGVASHEFMALADTGEEAIATCTACSYAANLEQASIGRSLSDPCPRCQQALSMERGIEVGHVFLLGSKYSRAMQATFLNEKGEETFFEMGCYGIGVSRIIAAAIEQNHDERGMIWPTPLAPFFVHLLPVQDQSETVRNQAERLYAALLERGVEALLDDRPERPGVKFYDADLIGIPYQVIVGEKRLKEGQIEIKERYSGKITALPVEQALDALLQRLGSFQPSRSS